MEPNEAMKAMARRIAADFYEADERIAFQLFAPAVRDGKHDDDEAVQCALAAIMETQRLDVALAEQWIPMPGNARQMKGTYAQGVFDVAQAIRTGEHYALAGERHG